MQVITEYEMILLNTNISLNSFFTFEQSLRYKKSYATIIKSDLPYYVLPTLVTIYSTS